MAFENIGLGRYEGMTTKAEIDAAYAEDIRRLNDKEIKADEIHQDFANQLDKLSAQLDKSIKNDDVDGVKNTLAEMTSLNNKRWESLKNIWG